MHTNDDRLAAIKQALADSECIQRCAERYGTLGDPTRMKICYLLRHHPALTVSQIAELTGISISAASHSLKKLAAADVVERRRAAKLVYYSLQRNPFTTSLLEALAH